METYDVVCIGYVGLSLNAHVDSHPISTPHSYFWEKKWGVSTDVSIVASTLARWGLKVLLIGNSIGNDFFGKMYMDAINENGVITRIGQRSDIETPLECIFTDQHDTRYWYSEDNPQVWMTLSQKNMLPIINSKLLYVDWYATTGVTKAVDIASQNNIPVYLNLGRSACSANIPFGIAEKSTYCQTGVDVTKSIKDSKLLACSIQNKYSLDTVIVTQGEHGCVGCKMRDTYYAKPPSINIVDTNGAGATFSAASIYSKLAGWDFVRELTFATSAASIKCETFGLLNKAINEIEDITHSVSIVRL